MANAARQLIQLGQVQLGAVPELVRSRVESIDDLNRLDVGLTALFRREFADWSAVVEYLERLDLEG